MKGFRKRLNKEDLLQPLQSQESKRIGKKLEESWNKEVTTSTNPSLWRALCRVFLLKFAGFGVMYLITESLK